MTIAATRRPAARNIAEELTFKLVSQSAHVNEANRAKKTGAKLNRRYSHTIEPDGISVRVVTLSPDLRISCSCVFYNQNVLTATPVVCEHVEAAVDLYDALGWNRMPTWKREHFPNYLGGWTRTEKD